MTTKEIQTKIAKNITEAQDERTSHIWRYVLWLEVFRLKKELELRKKEKGENSG